MPYGDILIHAGDMTNGNIGNLKEIDSWFGGLNFKHKVCINLMFDVECNVQTRKIIVSGNMDGFSLDGKINGHELFKNAIYLEDESIELEGIKFYGIPWTPRFVGGFQLFNDEQTRKVLDKIPTDVNVLISHGPPHGILDKTSQGCVKIA